MMTPSTASTPLGHGPGQIHTAVVLSAPPERVWRALTDLSAYRRWNPFVRRAEGRIAPGERIRVRIGLGGDLALNMRPLVTEVVEGERLRWRVRIGPAWLFRVDRGFELTEVGGGTRFEMWETFSGLMGQPTFWVLKSRLERGYWRMNEAMRRRVEPRQPHHPAG